MTWPPAVSSTHERSVSSTVTSRADGAAHRFLTRYSAPVSTASELLHGRVAVVTGGGRGIGRAHSLLLAARAPGSWCATSAPSSTARAATASVADAVMAEVQAAGGEAVADHSDISTFEGAAQPVARTVDTFGQLDIVVNNAGLAGGGGAGAGAIESITAEQLERVFAVNFTGTIGTIRAAWPHLRAQGPRPHREHGLGSRARRPHPRRRGDRVRRGQGRGVVGDLVARAAGTASTGSR